MLIQTDNDMRQLLREMKVFALVGLSSNPERPSHKVAKYLMTHGYTVIPVNPVETEILGQKCYARLADIPQKVDVVDCFRKSADIPPLAQDAIAIGATSRTSYTKHQRGVKLARLETSKLFCISLYIFCPCFRQCFFVSAPSGLSGNCVSRIL